MSYDHALVHKTHFVCIAYYLDAARTLFNHICSRIHEICCVLWDIYCYSATFFFNRKYPNSITLFESLDSGDSNALKIVDIG